MYEKILVPLDGSAFSERALPMAGALAQVMGSDLVLMRAAVASIFPGADPTNAQCQAVEEVQSYLANLAIGLAEQGLRVDIAAPYGDAADSIVLEAGLRAANLVVMCTHGRSGLGRWIYGSVAEQVLARSPVPVLLVRPTGEPLSSKSELGPVLVPLDGSAFGEAALSHAATLARAFGSGIVLLRSVDLPLIAYEYMVTSPVLESLEDQRRRARSYLLEVAEQLRMDGFDVQTALCEGWPADGIVDKSVDSGSRLIVMATHGRTGIARLVLGSVALEVVRRSQLPVLLVRPAELAESAQGSGVQ